MTPALYLIAAILFVGGKLNNFNIKNHPLDIRVRRDVRTLLHYAARVSGELDTTGKLSTILDYERLRQQRYTIGVENDPEESSDISQEESDTNRKLSGDLSGEEINFNSVNPEESDIAGVEESNTNENLSNDRGDPEKRFNNVDPEEFSDIVANEGETAVEDATLAPIKEDGRNVKKYVVNRPKGIHRNLEEKTTSSTRRKRDLGNGAINNQRAEGWQKSLTKRTTSNGISTQYGPNTNKTSVPNTDTNIMRLYARLPYQKIANTTAYNRIMPYPNGIYPNSISYNQSRPTTRENPAPYNPNQGRLYNNVLNINRYNRFVPYNRSQPTYHEYPAPYSPNQGRVYRYNSTNNEFSKTNYGPYNQSQLISRTHPVPYNPDHGSLYNSNFSGNGLNRTGRGPYNQSQLIYRSHPVPYNPDQGSLYNSNFSGNGLNRTGHGPYNQSQSIYRTHPVPYNPDQGSLHNNNFTGHVSYNPSRPSYNVNPLPYSPYQGGYYSSNLANNGYRSKSPLYNNSTAYALPYTTGYQLPPSTTTENTTPLIVESCILCSSNGCPSLFRKIGFLCVPAKQ